MDHENGQEQRLSRSSIWYAARRTEQTTSSFLPAYRCLVLGFHLHLKSEPVVLRNDGWFTFPRRFVMSRKTGLFSVRSDQRCSLRLIWRLSKMSRCYFRSLFIVHLVWESFWVELHFILSNRVYCVVISIPKLGLPYCRLHIHSILYLPIDPVRNLGIVNHVMLTSCLRLSMRILFPHEK